MKKIMLGIAIMLTCQTVFSQENINNPKIRSFYIYWGWNRDHYTTSDISFKGNDYNFKLDNVVATDKQTAFALNPYFKLDRITIPQTNFRIGYFISKHWNISIGTDHMKYVVKQNQDVTINGTIENTTTEYNGVYDHELIKIKEDFLKFEHTDGLNYINTEIRRSDNILDLRQYKLPDISFNITEGFGIGALIPRTNTTLLGNSRHDEFHVSGFGLAAIAGLNITFFQHFFLQGEFKSGFIDMPDIRTTKYKADRASQHFYFIQSNFLFGFNIKIKDRNNRKQVDPKL